MQWFDRRGFIYFFAISLPWHIAASLTEPSFAWFYFINEHVLRFLGLREPHDYYSGPWWYYIPRMLIYLFPWIFLLPGLLLKKRVLIEQHLPLKLFLTFAWLLPIIFFSLSSAKANYYQLVVIPFIVFQMAIAIDQKGFFNGIYRALPGLMIAGFFSSFALALLLGGLNFKVDENSVHFYGTLSQSEFTLLVLSITALLGLVTALVAWQLPNIGILAYLMLSFSTMGLCLIALQSMEQKISMRATAHYLQTFHTDHRVYLYQEYERQSSLVFYMRQPISIVDMKSNDLYWGDKLRPHNLINVDTAVFSERLINSKIVLVVSDKNLDAFRATDFSEVFKGNQRIGAYTIFFN
jgi:hypothetical protein